MEFEDGAVKEELYPEADISAPIGKSFKTTSPVVFRSKDEKDVELRFGGLQVNVIIKIKDSFKLIRILQYLYKFLTCLGASFYDRR